MADPRAGAEDAAKRAWHTWLQSPGVIGWPGGIEAMTSFLAGFAAGLTHAESASRLTIACLQDDRDRWQRIAQSNDRIIDGPIVRT